MWSVPSLIHSFFFPLLNIFIWLFCPESRDWKRRQKIHQQVYISVFFSSILRISMLATLSRQMNIYAWARMMEIIFLAFLTLLCAARRVFSLFYLIKFGAFTKGNGVFGTKAMHGIMRPDLQPNFAPFFFFFLFASFQCQPGAGWHCQMNLFSFLHRSDVYFLTSPKVTSILLHLALLLLSKKYLRLQGARWHFCTASCSAAFWEWAKFNISESNDNDSLAKANGTTHFYSSQTLGDCPRSYLSFFPPLSF